jgi:hypothetical protein
VSGGGQGDAQEPPLRLRGNGLSQAKNAESAAGGVLLRPKYSTTRDRPGILTRDSRLEAVPGSSDSDRRTVLV